MHRRASCKSKLQSDLRLLLEYYREKDVVVLVTKSVILVQFSLSADGKVTNESKLMLGWKRSCESKGRIPQSHLKPPKRIRPCSGIKKAPLFLDRALFHLISIENAGKTSDDDSWFFHYAGLFNSFVVSFNEQFGMIIFPYYFFLSKGLQQGEGFFSINQ